MIVTVGNQATNNTTETNEIEDYDYYEHKRQEHLDLLKERKAVEFARKREKQKIKSLAWRKDGVKALSSLHGCVANLKSVLMPHNYMKQCMAQFGDCALAVNESSKCFENNRCQSILLVRQINPVAKNMRIKLNLVLWKNVVLQSIRLHRILHHPFDEYYVSLPVNWRTFRNLFRVFMRYVPVEETVTAELKKKRLRFKNAKAKLELIYSTMRTCEYILVCKSMQHTNPKGCSHCGVQYIGGTLGGVQMYVTSYSRDTGVPTLVTLEFEMESLRAEEVVQLKVVQAVQEELAAFEEVVMADVVVRIQRWWGIVLAWKRVQRRERRRLRSLYWFRIRRLAAMKRYLDVLILERDPIDMQVCGEKYCDLLPELREYVAVITERKRLRMLKWTLKFHRKLQALVEHARYLRYLESLKPKVVVVVEKPIVFKRPKPQDKRQFVCFRMECKLRKFLTQERYDTHMAVHRKDDLVRYAAYDRNRAAKMVRDAAEKEFTARVRESRAYLAQSNLFELRDYSVDEHFAQIIPPPAEVAIVTSEVSAIAGGGGAAGPSTAGRMSALMTAGYDFDGRIGNTVLSRTPSETVLIPPLQLPTDYDLLSNGTDPVTMAWTSMPHIYSLSGLMNSSLFSLEMVSKQGDVEVASRVPLDQPVIRIGAHSSCEVNVQCRGSALKEHKISQIHCLLYCSMSSSNGSQDGSSRNTVTLVDNSSTWGTYVVSSSGTRKVPTKITAGVVLTPGLLVCIGVCRDGPDSLSPTQANSACVVYRVRCLEMEG